MARVPTGKKFRLWAMGRMYAPSFPDYVNLRVTDGVATRELGYGVDYASYETNPLEVDGPTEMQLHGIQTNMGAGDTNVTGYMVFSIE